MVSEADFEPLSGLEHLTPMSQHGPAKQKSVKELKKHVSQNDSILDNEAPINMDLNCTKQSEHRILEKDSERTPIVDRRSIADSRYPPSF